MSDFFTVSDTLCAVFNTTVFWVGHVGMGYGALAFLWVTLWQVLIAQAGKQLHLYVSVAGGLADGHAVVTADLRYCVLRTGSGQDVRFQRGQIVRTITDFQVRAVGTFHIVSVALCLLRGVNAIIFPCVAVQLVHHAATELAADGGRPDADLFSNRGLRETELVQVFYQAAFCAGQWSAFFALLFVHGHTSRKNCRRVPWGPQRQFLFFTLLSRPLLPRSADATRQLHTAYAGLQIRRCLRRLCRSDAEPL